MITRAEAFALQHDMTKPYQVRTFAAHVVTDYDQHAKSVDSLVQSLAQLKESRSLLEFALENNRGFAAMTVAELIAALQKMPQDAEIGAVPSWGCTILRARIDGKWAAEIEMPTDPDVWPIA